MSAEIFGERFYARGEPGWHNIGTTFDKDLQITLVEAGHQAGIIYDTKLVPVYAEVQGKKLLVPDRMAVVREPLDGEKNWQPLEVVGKNYKLVTNLTICETFDVVSTIFPVETIGALGNGERMFAVLDAGMVDIQGDVVHQYFTLYDEKSGRSATKFFYTPVRVVCQNTLRMGLSQATLTVNVSHTKGNVKKMERIASVVLDMQMRMNEVNALFGNMAKTPFSLTEFREMVTKIYALPPEPKDMKAINVSEDYEKLREQMQMQQNAALVLQHKWNDEQPKLANTQWGAYNVIVELEDWKQGRGKLQYTSAMFGERALTKQTAFGLITGAK